VKTPLVGLCLAFHQGDRRRRPIKGVFILSKTILAQVDGFTPVIDGVIADVGLVSAAVFGKAWRYCQMSDGVCKASQDRLADELGLSRATVNAHLAKLTQAGYLKDLTPDLLGVPHQYADTGKANLSISLTATCQKDLHLPVKNFDTKKVLKKALKERPKNNIKVVVVGADNQDATTTLLDSRIRNPFFYDNLETCKRVAITEPQASIISNSMPLSGTVVDPEFIEQHVATLAEGETIGLAITRIKAGEKPRPWVNKETEVKDYVRYSQGVYS
jgi:hypothetical protein